MMSLLFNMLSSFVIVFLPRSKCLLISWLQSLSTVILEPKKIKSASKVPLQPSALRAERTQPLGENHGDRETRPWEQAKHKFLSY